MKDSGILNQICTHFLSGQHHVRTRIANKAELPFTTGKGMHKGKRRRNTCICHQAVCTNSNLFYSFGKLPAEHICSDFSDECSTLSQLGKHGKHITGSAARIRFQQGISLRTDSAFGEIDQQFTQSCYIIFFHCIPLTLSYTTYMLRQ